MHGKLKASRILCLGLLLSGLLLACGGSKNSANDASGINADALPQAVDRAVRAAGGYEATIHVSNFVLPQWGGSDGGKVRSNGDGTAVEASLRRTGDGNYTIITTGGTTYFKRESCDQFARIPGGGPTVLDPLNFAGKHTFAALSKGEISRDGDIITWRTTIKEFGPVVILVNAKTNLPIGFSGRLNGEDLSVAFAKWGAAPEVEKPSGDLYDRGPGGNPC